MSGWRPHDIVRKLIGPIRPTGDHGIDVERSTNLEETIALTEALVAELSDVAVSKDRAEASMASLGERAQEALDELRASI